MYLENILYEFTILIFAFNDEFLKNTTYSVGVDFVVCYVHWKLVMKISLLNKLKKCWQSVDRNGKAV